MGVSYHISAEGQHTGSHEDSLLEHGIMMSKGLWQEVQKDLSSQWLTRKSSVEYDMRSAISAAERV